MRNFPEGGVDAPGNGITAQAPRLLLNPEDLYFNSKMGTDAYLHMLGLFSPDMYRKAVDRLQNTRDYSSRKIAGLFDELSDYLWTTNRALSLFGLSDGETSIEIQLKCNHRLWTHNADETLNRITSDMIVPLFREGREDTWPNLLLTSNHARAWRSKDLVELMDGAERIAADGHGRLLDTCRLTRETPPHEAYGKTITVLACHAERDIFHNGAQLIRRRLNLLEDPNRDIPALRTHENMSPAAVRLAKLMLKCMVEPPFAHHIDLDRCIELDEKGNYRESYPKKWENPYVADEAALQDARIIMRADATHIAQHIKLVAYSRGANTATDALRFFYQECAALGDRLLLRQNDGRLINAASNEGARQIAAIINNVGLLSMAPGEVPLTKAEKEQVGMRRVTLLNTHDLTAGHLINPDKAEYDPWADKLICINGTREDAGHNLVSALGNAHKAGYIMDPARAADDPNYQQAQDEVKAFYASNFGKIAITEMAFARDEGNKSNELHIQCAPGVSRSGKEQVETLLRDKLREHGFPDAVVYSDLKHRRRIHIILEENAPPIAQNPDAVARCHEALHALQNEEGARFFITRDALESLSAMETKSPRFLVSDIRREERDTKRVRA